VNHVSLINSQFLLFTYSDLEKPGTSGGLEGADVWGDQDDVSISNKIGV